MEDRYHVFCITLVSKDLRYINVHVTSFFKLLLKYYETLTLTFTRMDTGLIDNTRTLHLTNQTVNVILLIVGYCDFGTLWSSDKSQINMMIMTAHMTDMMTA